MHLCPGGLQACRTAATGLSHVATMGITHLYPEVLLREARSLGNQVLCMIAEYHLRSHAQGSPNLSPVLLEAARDLLPPVESYIGGGAFHGSRDMRVVERGKTLRIALATPPRHGGGGDELAHRLWMPHDIERDLFWICF